MKNIITLITKNHFLFIFISFCTPNSTMERPSKITRSAPEKETGSYPPSPMPQERESYPISPSPSEASISTASGKRKQFAPVRALKKSRANESFSIAYYLQKDPDLIKSRIQGHALDLSGLSISSLDGLLAVPGIKNIFNLSLAHNSITQIERKDFLGLSQLITLDLSNNDIEVLATDGFEQLANLINLFLNNNRIRAAESDSFSHLNNLKKLSLSHNRLTALSQKMFAGMPHLEELDLNDNIIADIENHAFSNTPFIKKLKLNKNKLTKLTGPMFEGTTYQREQIGGRDRLNSLEGLDLRDNKLTEIPASILIHLPNLARLLLTNNQIAQVTPQNITALKKATSLKMIDLVNNKLNDATLKKLNAALPNIEIVATVSMETTQMAQELMKVSTEEHRKFAATKSLSDFEKKAAEESQEFEEDAATGLTIVHPLLYDYIKSRNFEFWHLVKGSAGQQWYELKNLEIANLEGLLDLPWIENVFRIYLNNNKIKSIPARAFAGLNKLRDIDLTNNEISSIDPQAFEGLPNLQSLNISSNPSLPLNRTFLAPLKNLSGLILEKNNIKIIPSFLFQDLTRLESLFLGHNELTHISSEQLAGLENLKYLMLNNNQIKYIDPTVFKPLIKLKQLNLMNNPLSKENVEAIRKVLPKTKIFF